MMMEKVESFMNAALVLGLILALLIGFLRRRDATIPDLTGMALKEAQRKARETGYKIKEGEPIYSESIKENKVASQMPAPGRKAEKGSVIKVNLSMGSAEPEAL